MALRLVVRIRNFLENTSLQKKVIDFYSDLVSFRGGPVYSGLILEVLQMFTGQMTNVQKHLFLLISKTRISIFTCIQMEGAPRQVAALTTSK